MAALLNLPHELRLHIYEVLLSRQPYHIYVDEYFAKDCQPEWIQLKRLTRFDPSMTSEILRIYWHSNTFTIPEVNTATGVDQETSTWINEHVKGNVKDLRHLEFGFAARCSSPKAGLSNQVCYNVVSVGVQGQVAKLSKSGRRGDGCTHVNVVVERINSILATASRSNESRQVTREDFWALYRSCRG